MGSGITAGCVLDDWEPVYEYGSPKDTTECPFSDLKEQPFRNVVKSSVCEVTGVVLDMLLVVRKL